MTGKYPWIKIPTYVAGFVGRNPQEEYEVAWTGIRLVNKLMMGVFAVFRPLESL